MFRGLSLVATSLVFAGAIQAHAETSNLILFDPVGGNGSTAAAINNAGVVVGSSTVSVSGPSHATRWDSSGTATDLDPLGRFDSQAVAINEAGVAVGSAIFSGNLSHAAVWDASGTATDLGTLPPFGPLSPLNRSFAYGINDAGVVAGTSTSTGYDTGHRPLTWNGTTATDLGGANQSEATAINDAGAVAGWSSVAATTHATLWNGAGTPIDLGASGGLGSQAFGINDAGVVVGYVNGAGHDHATAWSSSGTPTDLGTLGGTHSFAEAINDAGIVVGNSYTTGDLDRHATLWNGTSIIDLNSFLTASEASAGWVLKRAAGINDQGEIVGSAYNTISDIYRGFELSVPAVPEPETYALMLAGLSVVGFVHRRRKRR